MLVTKVDRVVSIEVKVGRLQCKVSQVGCVSKVLICAKRFTNFAVLDCLQPECHKPQAAPLRACQPDQTIGRRLAIEEIVKEILGVVLALVLPINDY